MHWTSFLVKQTTKITWQFYYLYFLFVFLFWNSSKKKPLFFDGYMIFQFLIMMMIIWLFFCWPDQCLLFFCFVFLVDYNHNDYARCFFISAFFFPPFTFEISSCIFNMQTIFSKISKNHITFSLVDDIHSWISQQQKKWLINVFHQSIINQQQQPEKYLIITDDQKKKRKRDVERISLITI